MSKKSILLTGATGFLGSHLLEGLIRCGYKVIILKRSFSDTWRIDSHLDEVFVYDIDRAPIEMLFEEHSIDAVIHTATSYGRNGESISETVNANLVFPLKLLDTAQRHKVKTFFNTDTFFTPSYDFLKTYSLSKKQFYEWLQLFSRDIQVLNLRIQHIIGPKDDPSKFAVWLIAQLLEDKDEIKLTKGEQKRDFIYVDDVVNAYLMLLEKRDALGPFSLFDVGTGVQTSLRDFVVKTRDVVSGACPNKIRTNLNFGALPYREGEFMNCGGDIDDLLQLGWKPGLTLSEAIERTVLWYKGRREYEKNISHHTGL